MRRLKVSIAALGAALLLVGPMAGTSLPAESDAAEPTEPVTIEMTVTGLSCPFCVYGLEKRLKTLEGLETLEVDTETGEVMLVLEDGREVSEERIRELVNEAGFNVDRFTRAPWIPDVD